MKKIILILLISPYILFAQINLNYNQTQDIEFAKSFKNNTEVNSYKTKDGLTINIGDTITIGRALTKKEKQKYNDTFTQIVVGNVKSVLKNEFRYLPYSYKGEEAIVQSIFVNHEKYTGYNVLKNKKEMPLFVSVYIKIPKQDDFNSIKGISNLLSFSRLTILNLELALTTGELLNPNQPLTKEEAIKKLKESKDLMELGLLSKKEYNRLKKELTPLILK